MSVPTGDSAKNGLKGITERRRRLMESILLGDPSSGFSTRSNGSRNYQGAGACGGSGRESAKSVIDDTAVVIENITRLLKEGMDLKEVMKDLDGAIKDLDEDIVRVKKMTDLNDLAVKFQHGININKDNENASATTSSSASTTEKERPPSSSSSSPPAARRVTRSSTKKGGTLSSPPAVETVKVTATKKKYSSSTPTTAKPAMAAKTKKRGPVSPPALPTEGPSSCDQVNSCEQAPLQATTSAGGSSVKTVEKPVVKLVPYEIASDESDEEVYVIQGQKPENSTPMMKYTLKFQKSSFPDKFLKK